MKSHKAPAIPSTTLHLCYGYFQVFGKLQAAIVGTIDLAFKATLNQWRLATGKGAQRVLRVLILAVHFISLWLIQILAKILLSFILRVLSVGQHLNFGNVWANFSPEVIGQGAQGVVYKALDSVSGRWSNWTLSSGYEWFEVEISWRSLRFFFSQQVSRTSLMSRLLIR